MKKTNKLQLKRETLRSLASDDMARAAGGATVLRCNESEKGLSVCGTICKSCFNTCIQEICVY